MPVPTEVLNEDIKELKGEIREIRSTLDVLKADIHRIGENVAELRSDVRSIIGIGKWSATILVTAVFASGGGAIWWAATLTSKVNQVGEEMATLRMEIENGLVPTIHRGIKKDSGDEVVIPPAGRLPK